MRKGYSSLVNGDSISSALARHPVHFAFAGRTHSHTSKKGITAIPDRNKSHVEEQTGLCILLREESETTLASCSRSEGGGRRRCRPVTTPAATCVSLSHAPTLCSRQRDCSRHRKLPLRCALAQTAAPPPPPPPDRRLSELRNGRDAAGVLLGTRFNVLLRFVSLSPPRPCCGARIHHVFSRTTAHCRLASSAHAAYPAGLREGVACLLVSGSLAGGAPRQLLSPLSSWRETPLNVKRATIPPIASRIEGASICTNDISSHLGRRDMCRRGKPFRCVNDP